MDVGLSWVSDAMRTLAQLFPRIVHVPATHEGVMFTWSLARRIGPGVHVYWPPVSQVILHPVKRDTIQLPPQTLPAPGNSPVGITVSVTVVYTISDIKKALVDTYDLMSTVTDRAQAGVIQAIIGKDIHELVQQHQHINNEIAKKVRADLKKFGVEVETAFMSSYHLSNTHLIIGSASVLPVDTETEEAEE